MEFIVPLENFSLTWRRHLCRWRAANFDLCSALMAIEQWGFFNVPHPLRHGPTVYNGHLRGSVTLTSNAERLVVELSLPGLSRSGIEPRSPACEANTLPLRHRCGLLIKQYHRAEPFSLICWSESLPNFVHNSFVIRGCGFRYIHEECQVSSIDKYFRWLWPGFSY